MLIPQDLLTHIQFNPEDIKFWRRTKYLRICKDPTSEFREQSKKSRKSYRYKKLNRFKKYERRMDEEEFRKQYSLMKDVGLIIRDSTWVSC